MFHNILYSLICFIERRRDGFDLDFDTDCDGDLIGIIFVGFDGDDKSVDVDKLMDEYGD